LIDNVVTALSDVARLPEPAVSSCDIPKLLFNVVETVALPTNIDVQFDFPADGFHAAVDPNQIAIVFRNLVRNARDAMPEGGIILINGKVHENELCVQVSDTGIGICDEDMGRITEPLFSTKARGMGLGLAISVAILKKNRGRLEVQSRVGEGAMFSVHLERPVEALPRES
jgi:two-component system sensor kinase FixL